MPTGIPYIINPDGTPGQGWNVTAGCSHVSAGCDNCWAERMARRLRGMALAHPETAGRKAHYQTVLTERGDWNGRVELITEALVDPLGWRKPRTVFVGEMADLFHPEVPFEYIAQVFGVMTYAHWHTFLVLTKRPGRAQDFFQWLITEHRGHWHGVAGFLASSLGDLAPSRFWVGLRSRYYPDCCPARDLGDSSLAAPWPLPNVWLGVSVEDQRTADERIPLLLECPAAHRWVSYEPGLGPVAFEPQIRQLDWVVVGCESGPGRRPFDLYWALKVDNQCFQAGVPVFIKQLPINGKVSHDPADWPRALRVRELGWETRKHKNTKTQRCLTAEIAESAEGAE